MRTSRDERVVHVEPAQSGVRSLSSCALPVRIDHPRNAELILFVGPAKRHYHIRASAIIDLRLLERERSIHRFAREDHTREIRLLQKFHQPPCDCDVVRSEEHMSEL